MIKREEDSFDYDSHMENVFIPYLWRNGWTRHASVITLICWLISPKKDRIEEIYAMELWHHGRKRQARRWIKRVCRRPSAGAAAYLLLSRCEADRDNHEAALQAVEKAIALESGDIDLWKQKSELLLEMGKPQEAESAINAALELAPKEPSILSLMVQCFSDMERYAEAEAIARQLHKMLPGNRSVYVDLGYAIQGQGRYAEAAKIYAQGMEKFPTSEPLRNLHKIATKASEACEVGDGEKSAEP